MKKGIFSTIILSLVLVFTGCSDGAKDKDSVKTDKAAVTEETKTEQTETKETVAQPIDVTPDLEEHFTDADVAILISNDTNFLAQVAEFNAEEYEPYRDKCKEMGFNDIQYQENSSGDKIFYAYRDDGKYYLELAYIGDSGIMDVICKVVDEEK